MDPIEQNEPFTPPPPTPPPPVGGTATKDERLWGMLAHLTALSGLIGLPLGNIFGPLIIWLIKKNEMPFVDDQGKEALNFQITILIGYVISTILSAILIGFLLFFVVWVVSIIFAIMAGIAANRGERYRYPATLRLIK